MRCCFALLLLLGCGDGDLVLPVLVELEPTDIERQAAGVYVDASATRVCAGLECEELPERWEKLFTVSVDFWREYRNQLYSGRPIASVTAGELVAENRVDDLPWGMVTEVVFVDGTRVTLNVRNDPYSLELLSIEH